MNISGRAAIHTDITIYGTVADWLTRAISALKNALYTGKLKLVFIIDILIVTAWGTGEASKCRHVNNYYLFFYRLPSVLLPKYFSIKILISVSS